MRSREFLHEGGGVIGKRRQSATRGLHTFKDTDRWNSGWSTDYTFLRVMMAAASTDGKIPLEIDGQSWIGKSASAHPYTQQDADKLRLAYQAVGAEYCDLNHGDLRSQEIDTVNKVSPVKGFKGYPR